MRLKKSDSEVKKVFKLNSVNVCLIENKNYNFVCLTECNHLNININ
jgi:hypothetical protein